MDPKVTMLFLLIGAIIGLSHLSDENLAQMKQQLAPRRWRILAPRRWRKIVLERRKSSQVPSVSPPWSS